MIKETYERLQMDVTLFDAEDIITTSEPAPEPTPTLSLGRFEMGLNVPLGI